MTRNQRVAAHHLLSVWYQYGDAVIDPKTNTLRLPHWFMQAGENACAWLESLGLVIDQGYEMTATELGMEVFHNPGLPTMKYDPVQRTTDIETMAAHLTARETVEGDAYFNAVCNYYDLTVDEAMSIRDCAVRASTSAIALMRHERQQTYAVVVSDGHMPTRVLGPYATEALARAQQRRTAGYSIVCPMGAT